MDDDEFLYGSSSGAQVAPQSQVVTPIETSVPQPTPVTKREDFNSPVAQLEASVESSLGNGSGNGSVEREMSSSIEPKAEEDEDGEGEGEDDESEDDVEIIMEPTSRSLDLRPQNRPGAHRPANSTFTPTKAGPQPPGPSLTTEYTPRERGGPLKPATDASQNASQITSSTSQTSSVHAPVPDSSQPKVEDGPDPSTLPPVTAPPSHPLINPSIPGTLDGRSILEVDIANMAEKPWRRPGSDISDWFNYGFDEISWEAYCFRRREVGDLAGVLKANVLNFAGMPEDQLTQLPPEIRTMVMAGSTAMMANGGGGQMMPGMNGMMGPGDMSMQGMMGPMMVGMGGDMGMVDGSGQVQNPQQEQGMGEGYPQGGPPGGMNMNGMGMGPEYGMQDPNAMQAQMYPNMEAPAAPPPVPVGSGPRGGTPNQFRGRGINPGPRGRVGYAPRGRGPPNVPVRPASPLPPNVPTGPRNQNKYKDRDNNAQAVDGLDYGGGQDRGGSMPLGEHDERVGRKRRERSPSDDRRDSKRR